MNILVYRYGSICEPDFIDGFRELGHEVYELTYEMHNKNLPIGDLVSLVSHELMQRSYDFVFSINFYPFLSEVCNIVKIRYVCQTVDSPLLELYSNSIKNAWNRIFVFDMAQYRDIFPLNPNCVFHLPLATNVARWDDVISHTSDAEHKKYSSDISFVGSLYTEKNPYDKAINLSPYLKGYLDGLMNAQQKVYGYNFLEETVSDSTVREFCTHMPDFYIPPELSRRDDRATMVRFYMEPKISSMERLHLMNLIGSDYSLDLYTGSDTTGLPVHNHGRAKTHTEMPLIFHNSKINLNITSKSIREGLPLRIFDILGCGGFLITNYQSELDLLFTPGEDLELYTCDEELMDKIAYYLSHPQRREEIAQNGYQKAKKYHNYPERLLTMISFAFGLQKKEDSL